MHLHFLKNAYAFKTNAYIYCICRLKNRAYALKIWMHIVTTLIITLAPLFAPRIKT